MKGNKEAKALARGAADRQTKVYDEPDLTIIPRFNLTSTQLSKLTQVLAYQGIYEQKRGMTIMLDITRYAAEEAFGVIPSDKNFGTSIQNKD